MTIPDPDSLSPKLSGTQREYIRAVATQIAKTYVDGLREEFVKLLRKSNQPTVTDAKVAELVRRMTQLEARYKEDDKFTLTSAKIQALMKEKGIE